MQQQITKTVCFLFLASLMTHCFHTGLLCFLTVIDQISLWVPILNFWRENLILPAWVRGPFLVLLPLPSSGEALSMQSCLFQVVGELCSYKDSREGMMGLFRIAALENVPPSCFVSGKLSWVIHNSESRGYNIFRRFSQSTIGWY